MTPTGRGIMLTVKLTEIQLTDPQDIAIEPSYDRGMLGIKLGVYP